MIATAPTGLDTATVDAVVVIPLAATSVSLSNNGILLIPRFSAVESELALFAESPCFRIYPPFTLREGVCAVNVSKSILSFTI